MDIKLIDKIESFRSSLKELIAEFQDTFQKKNPDFKTTFKLYHYKLKKKRNATTIGDDVGVVEKKPRKDYVTGHTLPNELQYTPFSGDPTDLFPELRR